jgi:Transposase IS66 family
LSEEEFVHFIQTPFQRHCQTAEASHQGKTPAHARNATRPSALRATSIFSEEIDQTGDCHLTVCPDRGGWVEPSGELARIVRQVVIIPRRIEISQHRGMAHYRSHCQKTRFAAIDKRLVRAGLVGPRLSALIAHLKGVCHCAFFTIRKFLRDVACVTISRGQLAKLIAKASENMKGTYELLRGMLLDVSLLNLDETGSKDCGQRMWIWCFRTPLSSPCSRSRHRGATASWSRSFAGNSTMFSAATNSGTATNTWANVECWCNCNLPT